jgi:hypothetical protein
MERQEQEGKTRFSRTTKKVKNNLSLYNDMMMTMTIKMGTLPPTPKSNSLNSAKMATTGSLLLILPLPLIQSSWLRATLTTGEQEGKGEITKKILLPLVSRRSTLFIHSMSTAAIVPLLAFSFNCLINRQPLYSAGLCVTSLFNDKIIIGPSLLGCIHLRVSRVQVPSG